jgi:hypothetical protein
MTHTQTQGADGAGTKTAGQTMVLLPMDDPRRPLKDSGLPSVMIWAGGEAYDDLTADRAIDLDSCSLAVGIYRAMTEAHAKEIATLSPAPAATPGVPDSLREAFAAATDSPVFVHDFADPAVSSAPGCQDVSLSFVTPDHITAAFMGNGLAGTIDQARKDAVALAAAWNHVRALIVAQPAGQAGDAGAAQRANFFEMLWRDAEDEAQRLEAGMKPSRDQIAETFHEHRRERQPNLPTWSEVDQNSGAAKFAHAFVDRLLSIRPEEPAPNSTRTGAAETEEAVEAAASEREVLRKAVSNALHDNQFLDDWREMVDPVVDAALAARPEAPSDAGWSFDMEAAPRDGTPINVGRDNGCGWDLLVVWWSKSASEYPWHTEGGGEYPEHRFDCWATLTPPSDPAPSGQAEG